MYAQTLLIVSSAVYVSGGILLTFLPEEVAAFLRHNPDPVTLPVFQLLGAAYLGFAVLNWLNRRTQIGGIFGRPLVVANFAHAFMGVFALIQLMGQRETIIPWIVTVIFGILAAAFALLLFKKV